MGAKTFVFAAVALLAISSANGNILWNNSSGSSDYFDWQNGQSVYGYISDPTLIGNTLAFFPSNFRAESFNNCLGQVRERIEFNLIARSGYSFRGLSFAADGDYDMLGHGSVNAAGTLTIQNLSENGSASSSMSVNPPMPTRSGGGLWEGLASIDLTGSGWHNIRVIWESNLLAASGNGSYSFIENKVLGATVCMEMIPEPSTVAILTLGAFITAMRSRKNLKGIFYCSLEK